MRVTYFAMEKLRFNNTYLKKLTVHYEIEPFRIKGKQNREKFISL